jgi:hypothetical protein
MPLPSTMIPIANLTLNSATQTITFNNIPQNYTDLVLVSVFGATSGMDIALRFNGDTSSSNYGTVRMWANGVSGPASNRNTDTGIIPRTNVNQASTLSSMLRTNIMNYVSTSMFKSVIGRYDFSSQTEQHAGTWMSTAAINKIEVVAFSNTFTSGSSFTLYGIKAA